MFPQKRKKENEFQFKCLVCIQTLFSIQRTLRLRRSKGKIYNMPLHCNLISIEMLLERKTETLKCLKLPEDITAGMCHPLPNSQLGQLQTYE